MVGPSPQSTFRAMLCNGGNVALFSGAGMSTAASRRCVKGSLGRTCETCGIVQDKMKKCSGCRIAHYCSETCQTEAWEPKHKAECPTLKD